MKRYELNTDITLACSLEKAFGFFSAAENLETITPPELHFEYKTPLPIEMRRGALIEYRIRLFGIPFSWRTEITAWEPGVRFIDEQIAGPFKEWRHEHRFEALSPEKTRIADTVHYQLPLDPFGRIAHPIVRGRLDRIFAYRTEKVYELLDASRSSTRAVG